MPFPGKVVLCLASTIIAEELFQWTPGGLRSVGYECEGLRTDWVKDSRWLSVADADCTNLR